MIHKIHNRGFLIYFLTFFHLYQVYSQAKNNPYDSMICWRDGVKLKWKDFLNKSIPLNFGASAVTCAEVEVLPIEGDSDEIKYFVINRFNKNCSWVKDTSIVFSSLLLMHEQLHFDISELLARKIRLKIFQFKMQNKDITDPEFSIEVQRLFAEKKRINHLYDIETKYGTNGKKQREWNEKVKKELLELEKYKSTNMDCIY